MELTIYGLSLRPSFETLSLPKTGVIRLRVIEGPNARDQSAFSAFHSFLVAIPTNAGYIHATHA